MVSERKKCEHKIEKQGGVVAESILHQFYQDACEVLGTDFGFDKYFH